MMDESRFSAEKEKMRAALEVRREEAFVRFMAQPLTAIVISMIPAGENMDALKQLLKAAHEAGFNSGNAAVLEKIVARMPPDGHRP